MNEYNINVDFSKGRISTNLRKLVQNDYNTTKLNFTFDKEGRVLFKMLYPDGTQYVDEIKNNELIFGKGILNQEGTYEYEISLYSEDGRLTDYAVKSFEVRSELVDTDEIVEPDDRVPVLDTLINEVSTIKQDVADGKYNGEDGKDGITPTIGENGNWHIGDIDTGLPSRGETGKAGSIKFIPVNELPSENIEEDAIYLIPNIDGIEWNGDTTDRETITYMDYFTYYKVSDRVLTPEQILGGQFSATNYVTEEVGHLEITTGSTESIEDENVLLVGMEGAVNDMPLAIIIKQPTTNYPQTAGTYFIVMPDGSGYISSLSLRGETTYQKYIYVNGAWVELGGSAEVDLTNYPTKEEMDNAINEVMNSSSGSSEPYILAFKYAEALNVNYSDAERLGIVSELINKLYNKGNKSAVVLLKNLDTYTIGSNVFLNSWTDLTTQKSRYYFTGYAPINTNDVAFRYFSIDIGGSWTDNVFTATNIHISCKTTETFSASSILSKCLSKTNTTAYTPTNDYNPATKKYVDDSIANAITTTLGGSY